MKIQEGKIRFAAMSLLWGNPEGEQFEQFLQDAKTAGYDGIASFADRGGMMEYLDRPEQFSSLLQKYGLELASVDLFIGADFDFYRKVCDFMAALDCRHLVCLGGYGREPGDFAAVGQLMNRMGEIARERGIQAVYHNHTDMTGETAEDMALLLSYTDPEKVSVMCDVGHATKDFIHQPIEMRATAFMEKYWDRLTFIEFKDWHEETDLNTAVGQGRCNFDGIFSLLKERGYEGWITVEQNGHVGLPPGTKPLDFAVASRQYIKERMGM